MKKVLFFAPLIDNAFIISKRFFGVRSFYNYAMDDGIYKLLRHSTYFIITCSLLLAQILLPIHSQAQNSSLSPLSLCWTWIKGPASDGKVDMQLLAVDQASQYAGSAQRSEALKLLHYALRSRFALVRGCAARSLGEIKDSTSVPILCIALKDPDSSVSLSEWSQFNSPLPQLSYLYWRSEVIDALSEFGSTGIIAFPLVKQYLKPEFCSSRELSSSIHFVGKLKVRESIPFLIETLLATNRQCNRDAAAYALGAIGDPSTIEVLTRVSKEDESIIVRNAASTAIKEFGTLWQSK